MSKEAMKLALEAAYLAGFNDSAEGYNGEYPFRDHGATPTKDRHWVERRDAHIREALAEQPAQQEPVASIFISGIGEREFDDWGHDLPVGRNILYTSPPAQPEQEQLMSDQINYGMSVTQNGKRIDPMSIYKEPEQEPVAWLVCENWRKHSLFFTEEGAEDFKNAAQREDDLSGNLARWKAKPLYTSPPAQRKPPSDPEKNAQRYLFLRNNANTEQAESAWRAAIVGRGETMDEVIDQAIEAAHGIKENT